MLCLVDLQESQIIWVCSTYEQQNMEPEESLSANEALSFVDTLIQEKRRKQLRDVQRAVFRGSWEGKSYDEIREHYKLSQSADSLKRDIGYKLWNYLSDVIGEKISKNTLRGATERAYYRRYPANSTTNSITPIATFPPEERSPLYPPSENGSAPRVRDSANNRLTIEPDWDSAPEVNSFYGREAQLDRLSARVGFYNCNLLVLYGMSGIGKTTLAIQLARRVAEQFDFVIWRSLHSAPLLADLLSQLNTYFSSGENTSGNLDLCLDYICNYRCLIILDEFEAVLQSGVHDGSYRTGYEDYGDLVRQIAETSHDSCLILTSLENLIYVGRHPTNLVFSEEIKGFSPQETEKFFRDRSCSGTEVHWRQIVFKYWGHPLAFGYLAGRMSSLYRGNVAHFLNNLIDHIDIPDELQNRIQRHLDRLSQGERQILQYFLSRNTPALLNELSRVSDLSFSYPDLLEIIMSLRRRSLLDEYNGKFSIPRLISEYLRQQ